MAIGEQRDLETVREGLERWVRARRPGSDASVAPPSRPPAGLSSETLLVDVRTHEAGRERVEELVLRLPPLGDGLFPEYDLGAQARVQTALGPTGVPVAVPVAFEADPTWLGAPFLVMPRVAGRLLADTPPFLREGWLHDASAAQQARLHAGFLDVLARIHRLDWDACGLGFLARDEAPGLDAQLDGWERYLGWAGAGDAPAVLVDALAWCRAHRPRPEPPPSLLWGDVRLGNVVFDDALRPAAVLDWEMAALGPAEVDLGWFLALHDLSVRVVGPDLPGFPGRDALLGSYERRLGRPLLDLAWFEVLALVRSGAIMVRVARRLTAAGVSDDWLLGGNPAFDRLAELLS